MYSLDEDVFSAAVRLDLVQIEKGVQMQSGPTSSQRTSSFPPQLPPSLMMGTNIVPVPMAAVCFLTSLLQWLETRVVCVLTVELKTGFADELDTSFMALPWIKITLFTFHCRYVRLNLPVLFLLSFVLNCPIFCSIHLSRQRKAYMGASSTLSFLLAPLRPPPLLAVVFFCGISYSSKQRLSFFCSNALMTYQSI